MPDVTLSEVIVTPDDRPVTRIVAYADETTCIALEGDTSRVVNRYMLDYMLTSSKTKGFKSRNRGRVLVREREIVSNGLELDSADLDEIGDIGLSICRYPSIGINTDRYTTKESVDTTFFTNDIPIRMVKNPELFTLTVDPLAPKKDYKMSPGFLKFFGFTTDLTRADCLLDFHVQDKSRYSSEDLRSYTMLLEMALRGKWFRKMLHVKTKQPIMVTSTVKISPVELTFLTVDEAKALKKDPVWPADKFILPDGK